MKTEEYYYTNEYDVLGYDVIEITDDLLDVTVRRSGSSPDPQISWIIVTKNNDGDEGKNVDASMMLDTLQAFEAELSENTFHSLQLHLTAIRHFETQEKGDKVVKHMTSFIELIKYLKNDERISEDIYKVLKQDAEIVISNW